MTLAGHNGTVQTLTYFSLFGLWPADEAQNIKNSQSSRFTSLRSIRSEVQCVGGRQKKRKNREGDILQRTLTLCFFFSAASFAPHRQPTAEQHAGYMSLCYFTLCYFILLHSFVGSFIVFCHFSVVTVLCFFRCCCNFLFCFHHSYVVVPFSFCTELWSLLSFLMPDLFGAHTKPWFQQLSVAANGTNNSNQDVYAKYVEDMKAILSPFMLRRLKSQVTRKKHSYYHSALTFLLLNLSTLSLLFFVPFCRL